MRAIIITMCLIGGGGLRLKDRQSGQIIEETVPRYLKAVYKAMYETRVGRRITQVTTQRSFHTFIHMSMSIHTCIHYIYILTTMHGDVISVFELSL
jgi:hypothetical protein